MPETQNYHIVHLNTNVVLIVGENSGDFIKNNKSIKYIIDSNEGSLVDEIACSLDTA